MNTEAEFYAEGDSLSTTPASALTAGDVVQVAGRAGIVPTGGIAASAAGAVWRAAAAMTGMRIIGAGGIGSMQGLEKIKAGVGSASKLTARDLVRNLQNKTFSGDPVELRLKNITLVSQTRNGIPYSSTGYADCLREGAKAFGWADARARAPLPGHINPPTDPDIDGIYEDLNANGRLDFADVVLYFNQMTWIGANEPVSAFDLNKNGRIDFADIVALFNEI